MIEWDYLTAPQREVYKCVIRAKPNEPEVDLSWPLKELINNPTNHCSCKQFKFPSQIKTFLSLQ